METEQDNSYGEIDLDEWTHIIDDRKIKVSDHKLKNLYSDASRNVISLVILVVLGHILHVMLQALVVSILYITGSGDLKLSNNLKTSSCEIFSPDSNLCRVGYDFI